MNTWRYAERKEKRDMKKQKVETLVEMILRECPIARDDDDVLMIMYCRAVGYNLDTPYWQALLEPSPNRDTITRCRRKIQEKNPDLRATENVRRRRKKAEDEWKEYARS